MNKKILFFTGTRADFGKVEPLALACREREIEIGFFITGMHMLKKYGYTKLEVIKFLGATHYELINQGANDSPSAIVAKTIIGFQDFIQEHPYDLVVIHGDRIETLAVSFVCASNNIMTAHIEGGEITGSIDESIRHCNSKLCTTHFVSSVEAKARVESLGEAAGRVFNIGSPELDMHAKDSGVSIGQVKKYYDIPFDEYGIVIFHPVTTESNSIYQQAKSLFNALVNTNKNFVVIAPNNDLGSKDIFSVINSLNSIKFRIIPSMRFNYFSELMKNASLLIGNSSAGVREAPFIGLCSINIGSRQNMRSKSCSIFNVLASEVTQIEFLVSKYWGVRFNANHDFGVGKSATEFVKIIESEHFWMLPIQKSYGTL